MLICFLFISLCSFAYIFKLPEMLVMDVVVRCVSGGNVAGFMHPYRTLIESIFMINIQNFTSSSLINAKPHSIHLSIFTTKSVLTIKTISSPIT